MAVDGYEFIFLLWDNVECVSVSDKEELQKKC